MCRRNEILWSTIFNYLNFAAFTVACPCGLMDKASPSGLERREMAGEDWGFESLQGRLLFSFFFKIVFFFSFYTWKYKNSLKKLK